MRGLFVILPILLLCSECANAQLRDNRISPLLDGWERDPSVPELGLDFKIEVLPEHPDDNKEFIVQVSFNLPRAVDSLRVSLFLYENMKIIDPNPSYYVTSSFFVDPKKSLPKGHKYLTQVTCKFVRKYSDADIYIEQFDQDRILIGTSAYISGTFYSDGRRITIFRKRIAEMNETELRRFKEEYLRKIQKQNKNSNEKESPTDTLIVNDGTENKY